MVQRVFISSTKVDLPRHRDAVKEALIKNGYFPIEMDDFGARDVDPVTGCLRLVAESQLFLGIYAWRYGYVPPGRERSITAECLVAELETVFTTAGGPPKVLRIDNGPELVSAALQRFCEHKVGLSYIPAG